MTSKRMPLAAWLLTGNSAGKRQRAPHRRKANAGTRVKLLNLVLQDPKFSTDTSKFYKFVPVVLFIKVVLQRKFTVVCRS